MREGNLSEEAVDGVVAAESGQVVFDLTAGAVLERGSGLYLDAAELRSLGQRAELEDVRRCDGSVREDPAERLESPIEKKSLLGERPAGGNEEKHAHQKLEHDA